ncbi:hypothetical protein NX905_29185, partial [Burkholderia thailandensis]|uniref:hypothetical protein n=1 Tax=Burkholderia thailandensis TaxID=57975 RepID=UPI00217F208B
MHARTSSGCTTHTACAPPSLFPSNGQDYTSLVMHGCAICRYSSLCVSLSSSTDSADSSASVDTDHHRITIAPPPPYTLPRGGVRLRCPDLPHTQPTRFRTSQFSATLDSVAGAGGSWLRCVDGNSVPAGRLVLSVTPDTADATRSAQVNGAATARLEVRMDRLGAGKMY